MFIRKSVRDCLVHRTNVVSHKKLQQRNNLRDFEDKEMSVVKDEPSHSNFRQQEG